MDNQNQERENNIKSPDEIVISETETVVEPTKIKSATEPKPKKRVGLGILVTVLVLLLIGGALVIGYLWGNSTTKPASNTEANNSTANSENTNQSDTKEELAEEATAPEDVKITLFEKLRVLQSGASVPHENILSRTTSYSYIPALYDNSLNDSMKVSLVLDSLEFQPTTDTSFIVDFLKSSSIEYRRKAATSDEVLNHIGSVSYEDFNKAYTKLFGENHNSLEREYTTPGCRVVIYDSKGKVFYHVPISGCGGSGLPVDFTYIDKYTVNNDLAYVYTNHAHMTYMEDQSGINLYKDDDMTELVAQLEFSDPISYNSMPLEYIINHTSDFPSYRFNFEKDQNGNYYFKGVEKL